MPYAESGSNSNLYYSFEVAGVHVIMLGSYTDYDRYSDQYNWLKVRTFTYDPFVMCIFLYYHTRFKQLAKCYKSNCFVILAS